MCNIISDFTVKYTTTRIVLALYYMKNNRLYNELWIQMKN